VIFPVVDASVYDCGCCVGPSSDIFKATFIQNWNYDMPESEPTRRLRKNAKLTDY
jgi:hypothetical protein